MAKTYEVRGYTTTGIYAVLVQAVDNTEAIRLGKIALAELDHGPRPFKTYRADIY